MGVRLTASASRGGVGDGSGCEARTSPLQLCGDLLTPAAETCEARSPSVAVGRERVCRGGWVVVGVVMKMMRAAWA